MNRWQIDLFCRDFAHSPSVAVARVALAIAGFRDDPLVPRPSPTTEFTVIIDRPVIEHRIRLNQVAKWAEETTREGPAGVMKRQRVKALLNNRAVQT